MSIYILILHLNLKSQIKNLGQAFQTLGKGSTDIDLITKSIAGLSTQNAPTVLTTTDIIKADLVDLLVKQDIK